jgi:mono/diheme cytochrome c family protein
MAGEDMGKMSERMRLIFAISSVIFLIVLAVAPLRDLFSEWKYYKREYSRFADGRPDTKKLLADFHPGIDQIWQPNLNVTDRCVTCHQGINQPSLTDATIPEPFRAHPIIPHRATEWGCTVCHRGQGLATEVKEAHQTTLAWEQPILPAQYIQGACGVCHRSDIPEAPRLTSGRAAITDLNCIGCHKLQGIERPLMLGPDLTNIGNKTSREWIFKWLKDPRTLSDTNGNVSVNGYENEEEPRMPRFRLNDTERTALSAFLIERRSSPIEPYKFDSRVTAAWEKKPDLVDQGQARFRQMFCSTCHSLAVVRGGEIQLIGGDIGPELTKVGSKVKPDWLVFWLQNPQAYLPHSLMPRYGWSDEDLYKITHYIMDRLTDPDLLNNVRIPGQAQANDVQSGNRLFQQKGCGSCHAIAGMKAPMDYGPDLSAEGAKSVSELDFGVAKTPRNLIPYLESKIVDPVSVNPNARMPQYHFKEGDLGSVITAALSMRGIQTTPGIHALVITPARPEYQAAGDFGKAYERYKCYVCHRFNGYGGTLAPDLSYEGSRAQAPWIVDFLKNPQTLRPTLTFRMPQFNVTDQEAKVLSNYLALVMQTNRVDLTAHHAEFTSDQASAGKQLYEVTYQCQSCHTIGAAGGYVGPNLVNAGNWLNTAWIQEWLNDPQALVPDAIEPHRAFTAEEKSALTAYLVTLKQSGRAKASISSGGPQ